MTSQFHTPPNRPEAPVEVISYDASWPLKFEAERVMLESALSEWLTGPIVHVGSTAVPGLPAKPVIDIMAPVQSLESSLSAIDAAVAVGYVYFPYMAEMMHWFCKPSDAYRTHHLHLVPYESPLWLQRLAFRNALRHSPELASEYAELKCSLAKKFRHDREAYTQAKTPFVNRVLCELSIGNPNET